jgi:hypothetical protein
MPLPIGGAANVANNGDWIVSCGMVSDTTGRWVRVVCTRSEKGGEGAEVVFCVVGEVPLVVEPVQGLVEDVQWQRAKQAVTASVSMHVRKELESQSQNQKPWNRPQPIPVQYLC